MRRTCLVVCLLWAALPAAAEKWTYSESEHFEVYSTGGDRTARDALTYFERVHAYFAGVFRERPDVRLILVPHEPTTAHLERIERSTQSLGLPSPVGLGKATGNDSIVLGDRVGVLAALYGAGTMAYVGGGFGRAGLHSVLEPAAWGLPVLFGPRWRNSRDAELLLQAGAAWALPHERLGPAVRALQRQWQNWISDNRGRETRGAKAWEVVHSGVGASEQIADLLARLISRRRPRKLRS